MSRRRAAPLCPDRGLRSTRLARRRGSGPAPGSRLTKVSSTCHDGQGSAHLLVDVQGFCSTADGEDGGGYHPQDPARVPDTRQGAGPFAPSEERWVPLTGVPDDATAVDVNLTVADPTREGDLVTWSGDGAAPGASRVNFVAGQTVPTRSRRRRR